MDRTITALRKQHARTRSEADAERLRAACLRVGICTFCTFHPAWLGRLCFGCSCSVRLLSLRAETFPDALQMEAGAIAKCAEWILYSSGPKKKSHINRGAGRAGYFASFCGRVEIRGNNVGVMLFDNPKAQLRPGRPVEATCKTCLSAFEQMFNRSNALGLRDHFEWNIRALNRLKPKDV